MWTRSQSLGMQYLCIVCRTAKIVFKVRPGNKDVDLTQFLSIWVSLSDPTKYKYVHIMLKRRVWVLVCKINTSEGDAILVSSQALPTWNKAIYTGLLHGLARLQNGWFYCAIKMMLSRSLDVMLLQTAQCKHVIFIFSIHYGCLIISPPITPCLYRQDHRITKSVS